jgi:hypothetical protein
MAESPLKVEFMSGERVYKKSPEPMDGTGPKLLTTCILIHMS